MVTSKVQPGETFIPVRRTELIQLCLADGQLTEKEQQQFQEFCQILSAYYHFKLHCTLERLKDDFTFFNPEATPPTFSVLDASQLKERETELLDDFKSIIEQANYISLSQDVLQKVFQANSLIDLKTEVNFAEFEQMLCYYQGDRSQPMQIKTLFGYREGKIDIFDKVILLIKFKKTQNFQGQLEANSEFSSFSSDKIYIYLYRNLSKYDLEFIYPNVKISMTLKDRLLFGIPVIGTAIPLTIKILPQILLIVAVIFWVTVGTVPTSSLKVTTQEIQEITPVLVALFSVSLTLGGFAFKQYTEYKNKQIKFQKKVVETLFFRKMASHLGVIQNLVDSAEEEASKEIILVFYHLLTSKTPLTLQQLDSKIEEWMTGKLGEKINFDLSKTLDNLAAIQGQVNQTHTENESAEAIPLLRFTEEGNCQILSLEQAKQVIDYVWDRAFQYF